MAELIVIVNIIIPEVSIAQLRGAVSGLDKYFIVKNITCKYKGKIPLDEAHVFMISDHHYGNYDHTSKYQASPKYLLLSHLSPIKAYKYSVVSILTIRKLHRNEIISITKNKEYALLMEILKDAIKNIKDVVIKLKGRLADLFEKVEKEKFSITTSIILAMEQEPSLEAFFTPIKAYVDFYDSVMKKYEHSIDVFSYMYSMVYRRNLTRLYEITSLTEIDELREILDNKKEPPEHFLLTSILSYDNIVQYISLVSVDLDSECRCENEIRCYRRVSGVSVASYGHSKVESRLDDIILSVFESHVALFSAIEIPDVYPKLIAKYNGICIALGLIDVLSKELSELLEEVYSFYQMSESGKNSRKKVMYIDSRVAAIKGVLEKLRGDLVLRALSKYAKYLPLPTNSIEARKIAKLLDKVVTSARSMQVKYKGLPDSLSYLKTMISGRLKKLREMLSEAKNLINNILSVLNFASF